MHNVFRQVRFGVWKKMKILILWLLLLVQSFPGNSDTPNYHDDCLKPDLYGVFPKCELNRGKPCCIGLHCVRNPANKSEYRCGNQYEGQSGGGDLAKSGGGYDFRNHWRKFVPNMTQNHVAMKDLPSYTTHCLKINATGHAPTCNPKRGPPCCIGLECLPDPKNPKRYRCGNYFEDQLDKRGVLKKELWKSNGPHSTNPVGNSFIVSATAPDDQNGTYAWSSMFYSICVLTLFYTMYRRLQ